MTKLRITYTKSAIGYSQDQKDTVRSLGLRKLNSTALHDDTPSIRGMAFKVRHLVKVEELAEESAARPAKVSTVRPVKATLAPAAVAAEKPAAVKKPAVAATPSVADIADVVQAPAKPDNLELIEGIGPKIAAVLQAAGIVTFADLAAADTSRLSEILEQEPNLRLADPGTWSEQAALAAAGDWDAFKALTEQLKGGRRA
jgi:large subunit ribosomal protein L30